ncbi:MAG: type 4a pilus biogenesis protein PilO [Gammaproteobacteria bacterium]|nr:type 4a pilus biogenesis protein PilO [Gammaproteobacteria bacterium]
MNLKLDITQLRNIDFNDVSRWPMSVKAVAVVLICIVVLGAGLWLDTRRQLDTLESTRQKEKSLKTDFLGKQEKAANLDAYKAQMEEMRRSFGAMLRQLPSKTEVAELLVDISQTGLQTGLEFELFKPEGERPAEFYAELPITIKVAGTYHEFGQFVSEIAALPRIVTLQDFSIGLMNQKSNGKAQSGKKVVEKKKDKDVAQDMLIMEVTAKTFRYLDEEELLVEEGGAS